MSDLNHRPTHEPSAFQKLARQMGVDRAVGFAVLARFWQLLTGPITQLMIVFLFTEAEQGFYFAFLNLLAVQIFVELGLHVVLIHVASHEWSGMTFDGQNISGNANQQSRLASLTSIATKWYRGAAMVFFVFVAVCGVMFFREVKTDSGDTLPAVVWMAPWIVLVTLNALQLSLLPKTAVLEGCGRLPIINRVRFLTGVAGSLAVWLLISGDFGLWALCGSAAVRYLGERYVVTTTHRTFFQSLSTSAGKATIDWKTEVLPLQWRIAIQGAMLWLANHLAGLVLVKSHGLAVSGRFGMMWTILSALQAAALSWVDTRRPLFGTLIAEQRKEELDALFFRVTRLSVMLLATGTVLFTLGLWVANQLPYWFFEKLSERLPDPTTVLIFAVAMVIFQLAQCANIYVRSHKEDPFLMAAIVSSAITATLMVTLGHRYEIVGVGVGYFVGAAVVQTPWWLIIWNRVRHHNRPKVSDDGR